MGVDPEANKMREAKLRWFDHMKKRYADAPVRKCERLAITGVRGSRGRPEKIWDGRSD